MEAVLDRFGRILIPKKVREDFNLQPGAQLRIEKQKEAIVLTPVVGDPTLVVKDGVLVFSGRAVGDVDAAVVRHREERARVLGGSS